MTSLRVALATLPFTHNFDHHVMSVIRREVMFVPMRSVRLDVVDLGRVKAALRRRMQLMAEGLFASKVFVVVNGKGGVGKSSLSVALAAALAKTGLRVLLIEMDEQGNHVEDLGTAGTELADDGHAQAAAILEGKPLVPTGEARPNLFVVPGGAALEDVVEELYCQRRLAGLCDDPEDQLAWMGMYACAIDAVRDEYDVIILDVAPGCEALQLQALVAGEMVLIPSKSDPSSRKGLRTVARRFARARTLNAALRLLGVVVFGTNATATRVQTNIKDQLVDDLNGAAPVMEQTIRHVESAAVACRLHGKLPQELAADPNLPPALQRSMKALAGDYRSLAMEVLQAKAALDHATKNKEQAA
ncbi:ParA family protein [Streptomyces mirabilis]|uniref:ParA family protein n=1 Tax=Streptomyces mirabilis TaxID=68239 RepID=A0ABU3V4X2_9ACTN|nr:ParA family protein [Streptomyces mirabilis]MCX5355578.1 ParA family protein [Streptomyces mirabilis]MDU9001224.1 ParA family protein [Streptomyces mirabilis]